MNINNIINFFQTLGITMKIDESGNVLFIDNMSQEKMDTFYTTNPTPFLSKDEMDYEVTLNKLLAGGRVRVTSNKHWLMFKLEHPIIDRKRTQDVVIAKMEYANAENGVVKETYSFSFNDGRDSSVSITSTKGDNSVYDMCMFSSGDVEFKKDGKVGYFNGGYDENYDLSKSEMSDILAQVDLSLVIADYYSPLFPNMRQSLEQAKQSRTL